MAQIFSPVDYSAAAARFRSAYTRVFVREDHRVRGLHTRAMREAWHCPPARPFFHFILPARSARASVLSVVSESLN